jgi:hypothetical protein
MTTKHDTGKRRWSLLPQGTVERVIDVLEYGAAKYGINNWKTVPDARTRYYDASMRHLSAWRDGERADPESGLPHLAHAVCSLLFLSWFDETPPAGRLVAFEPAPGGAKFVDDPQPEDSTARMLGRAMVGSISPLDGRWVERDE